MNYALTVYKNSGLGDSAADFIAGPHFILSPIFGFHQSDGQVVIFDPFGIAGDFDVGVG